MTTTANVDMVAQRTSASIRIDATPEAVFSFLADPRKHGLFDGSGMVQDLVSGPERLTNGDRFGMKMKFGPLPYTISSTVVEFEENRLIAWQHFGKHRWRYELAPAEEGTLVTETFDWSTALVPKAIELAKYPTAHVANIEQTLVRLKDLAEKQS